MQWKASTAKHPSIDLKYTDEDYLIYGKDQDDKINAKHLTIIAVTGLVAHAATLKDLRQAHDTPGMVKEVETPKTGIEVEDAYRERYMTPKWDEVVPFPTSTFHSPPILFRSLTYLAWSLRYDE